MLLEFTLQRSGHRPYLARLQTLEDLSLRAVHRERPISNAGVAHLAGLKRLWKIDFSANPGLTDAAAETLAQLPRLRWLNLSRTPITGKALEPLARHIYVHPANNEGLACHKHAATIPGCR